MFFAFHIVKQKIERQGLNDGVRGEGREGLGERGDGERERVRERDGILFYLDTKMPLILQLLPTFRDPLLTRNVLILLMTIPVIYHCATNHTKT